MKRRVLLVLGLIFVMSNFAAAQTADRTVTNANLEKIRQKRLKEEADYRQNYKKRGMPSPEELERRAEADRRRLDELTRQREIQEQQAQQQAGEYWAARTNALRNDIVNIDGQINYLRGQISQMPERRVYSGVYAPYGVYYGGRRVYRNRANTNPAYVGPNVQSVISAQASPNASTIISMQQGTVGVFRSGNYGVFRGRRAGSYGAPYIVDNTNYSRDELVSRLQYLEQQRAGLVAQWNLLVEEARRAGLEINF